MTPRNMQDAAQIRRRIARLEARREKLAGRTVLSEERRARFAARLDAQIDEARKALKAAIRRKEAAEHAGIL